MVLLGFKTIQEGEQVLIRDHLGNAKVLAGPARVTLWRSKAERLVHRYADENQYLEINRRTGPRICLPGPAQIFENPVEHESVKVKKAVLVSANQALVVYKPSSAGGKGQEEMIKDIGDTFQLKQWEEKRPSFHRSVLYGPMRYIPSPGEWTHEFSWHGADPADKARNVKDALKFSLLRVIPDCFYYNVKEVRTRDDTLITVKLMIFHQLEDVERMLDATSDPIADFINASCSDVIRFCSGLTYEGFVEASGKMNDLKTYGQLTERAEAIGYKINKVVFRGFHGSTAMQHMHDNAINERTKLRLDAETEEHRQRTLDLQLIKNEERSAKEGELERRAAEHRLFLERQGQAERLKREEIEETHRQKMEDLQLSREQARSAQRREMEKLEGEHQREMSRQENNVKVELAKDMTEVRVEEKRLLGQLEQGRLDHMSGLGVEVSKVLVAECRLPDKTLRVENETSNNIHLHESA